MSLYGDAVNMRNGRSASQVSVYNYPEHLNPFYEDDQHRRLRFWKINKNNINERRNSFSLSGLKEMWAIKSFRLKKKSSTLGVNKTSESPPPLRRPMYSTLIDNGFLTYNRRERNSISSGDAAKFDRNAAYCNSVQNVHLGENPIQSGLNRNVPYRRTIQNVCAAPQKSNFHSRRYVYGGSATPQPQRGSRFGSGVSMSIEVLARGSSQTSVASTNPFETDNEDDARELLLANTNTGSLTSSKRPARKKHRAPAPPVPFNQLNLNDGGTDLAVNTCNERPDLNKENPRTILRVEEDLRIASLTAEIESFVRAVGNEAPLREKPMYIQNASKEMDEPPTTRKTTSLPTSTAVREMAGYPEKHERDIGHIECIQIHVGSQLPAVAITEPSRVTSFRSDSRGIGEEVTEKTLFTLVNPPKASRQQAINDSLRQQPESDGLRIVEDANGTPRSWRRDGNTTLPITSKPLMAVKPGHFAEAATRTNSKTVVKPPAFAENNVKNNRRSFNGHLDLKSDTGILKIFESKETLLEPSTSSAEANDIPTPAAVSALIPKTDEIDSLYCSTPRAPYPWKMSTLAPSVPSEKRKSVKDIIESINRSQRLLHAAAHKDQLQFSEYSTATDTSMVVGENGVGVYRESNVAIDRKPQSQQNQCELNNNFSHTITNSDPHKENHERISEEAREMGPSRKSVENDLEKVDNAKIFQKCRVNKEVYDFRETSPTSSNLDWNPVPKPKRTKNVPDI